VACAELRRTLLTVELGAKDEPLIGSQIADRVREVGELFVLEDAGERIAAGGADRVGDRVEWCGVVH